MVKEKIGTTKKHDEKTQNGQDFVHQEHFFLNLPLKWFICVQKKKTTIKTTQNLNLQLAEEL